GNMHLPLDEPSSEANAGPDSIHHRYITEDVPVGCKIYHELGKVYGVKTPIIDSMIVLASSMIGENYFEDGYTLEYMCIHDMFNDELVSYLNEDKCTDTWMQLFFIINEQNILCLSFSAKFCYFVINY